MPASRKSAAGRDLAELEALGHLSRKRRPGGVYVYKIARRFLPQWAEEQVSQHRDRKAQAQQARHAERATTGCPRARDGRKTTEEKPRRRRAGARSIRQIRNERTAPACPT